MIESPLIDEILAECMQESILEVLTARFGSPPADLAQRLGMVYHREQLKSLIRHAVLCRDLAAFRRRLAARRVPRRKA